MEAYKVWATLNLKGDAQQKMMRFVEQTQKANIQIEKLTKTLPIVSAQLLKIAETLKLVNPEFAKLSVSMIRFNTNVMGAKGSLAGLNTTISSSAGRMATASNRADKLAHSLQSVATASASVHKVNAGVSGGVRSGAGGRGVGGGTFGHGAAVGAVGAHFAGMGPAAAGFGTAALLKSSFHHAMEYQNEEALLLGQRIPGLDSTTINNFVNNTKIRGASKFDILQMLADAAIITKGKEEAMGVAPTLVKMKTTLGGLLEGGFSNEQMQAAVKTAEVVSASRLPEVLNKHLGMMSKTTIATSGRVNPSTYQSIVRSARGYTAGLDPDFFYYQLEPIIQEYGTRVGPMLAQFFQHMSAGRVTTQAAKLMGEMNLVNPDKVKKDKAGRIIGINPGGVKGISEVGSKNIFRWIDEFLTPAMDKITKNPGEREAIIGKIFTNSDRALITTYLQQKEKITASAEVNRNTESLDELFEKFGNLHAGKIQELSASFVNFGLALDKLTGPAIDKMLERLTGFFGQLANASEKLASWLPESSEDQKRGWTDNVFSLRRSSLLSNVELAGMQTAEEKGTIVNIMLDGEKLGRGAIKYIPKAVNSNVSGGLSFGNINLPFSNNQNGYGNQ